MKQTVAALIGAAVCASAAQAAPRAESAMECGVAADMALVAHSLAKEEIQRQKADAIMVRIYDVSQSERGKELMRDILDAAYSLNQGSPPSGRLETQRFAEELFVTCMKSGGNMDTILGSRS